jgi:hypothetical protein
MVPMGIPSAPDAHFDYLSLFSGAQAISLLKDLIRPFLCFSLFCVHIRLGFEQEKLQNKQNKISVKINVFSLNFYVIVS